MVEIIRGCAAYFNMRFMDCISPVNVSFCFIFNSKQITLNETRDTLRETYKMVSDAAPLTVSRP